jgi:hypothetical protein
MYTGMTVNAQHSKFVVHLFFFFLASTRIVKKSNTQNHSFTYPIVCLLALTEQYKLQDVTALDHSNNFLVYAICPSAGVPKLKEYFGH